jgi:hypothetical protein
MKKIVLGMSLLISVMSVNASETDRRSFFSNEAHGQLPASTVNVLNKTFSKYDVYSVDVNAVQSFLKKDGSFSRVDLNFGGNYQWQLTMELYDILSADYTMTEATPTGVIIYPRPESFTYKGYNGSDPADLVYLSVLPNFMSGFVQQNGEQYFIEPVSEFDKTAGDQLYVIYNSKDVKPDPSMTCGVTAAQKTIDQIGKQALVQGNINDVAACSYTEIAIAATNDFVVKFGGATATQTKIVSQLNSVNGLFAQPAVDIKYTLVKFYAASSNQITADSQTEITTCLSDFQTWANGGGFGVTYDVASLWVGRDLNLSGGAIGGYSYGGGGPGTGTICKSTRYNCIEDKGSSSLNAVLQSHELGHSWGAAHQTSCTCNIMNPIVQTSSNVWTPTCISTIAGTKTSSSCLSSCPIGINEIIHSDEISVYPNPFNTSFVLKITSAKDLKSAVMRIYDVCGKEVKAIPINGNETFVTRDELNSGFYFYTIINNNDTEHMVKGKLIVQ